MLDFNEWSRPSKHSKRLMSIKMAQPSMNSFCPLNNLKYWRLRSERTLRPHFLRFNWILLLIELSLMGNRISAFISWQGTWQRSTQKFGDESARGHGVLLWSGNQVILLRGVEGDLPFGIGISTKRFFLIPFTLHFHNPLHRKMAPSSAKPP